MVCEIPEMPYSLQMKGDTATHIYFTAEFDYGVFLL